MVRLFGRMALGGGGVKRLPIFMIRWFRHLRDDVCRGKGVGDGLYTEAVVIVDGWKCIDRLASRHKIGMRTFLSQPIVWKVI